MANRIFSINIENRGSSAFRIEIDPSYTACMDFPAPGMEYDQVPAQGSAAKLVTCARRQGHGCDGHNGLFAMRPVLENGATEKGFQHFAMTNDGGLWLEGDAPNYISQLSGPDSEGTYTWTVDPAFPSVSADIVQQLIQAYGPIVYFHPEEQYLLTNAEAFLENATLDGQPALAQLESGATFTQDHRFSLAPGADRGGDLATAKAYVHAKVDFHYVDLQFWFLYMYNGCGTADLRLLLNPPGSEILDIFGGSSDALDTTVADSRPSLEPFGEHEGDWEHITLRIDIATWSLLSVYFSQHDSGQWVAANDLERVGNHVVVYASHNGHASYPHAGANWSTHKKVPITPVNKAEFFLRNDCAQGASIDCSSQYELVAAEHLAPGEAVTEPAWLNFPGRWGAHRDENLTPENAMPIIDRAFGPVFGSVLGQSELLQLAWPLLSQINVESQDGPGAPKNKGCWLGSE